MSKDEYVPNFIKYKELESVQIAKLELTTNQLKNRITNLLSDKDMLMAQFFAETKKVRELKEQLAEERHKKRLYWDLYQGARSALLNARAEGYKVAMERRFGKDCNCYFCSYSEHVHDLAKARNRRK